MATVLGNFIFSHYILNLFFRLQQLPLSKTSLISSSRIRWKAKVLLRHVVHGVVSVKNASSQIVASVNFAGIWSSLVELESKSNLALKEGIDIFPLLLFTFFPFLSHHFIFAQFFPIFILDSYFLLPSTLPSALPPPFLPPALPTYLPSFLPSYLPSFLPTFLPTFFLPSFLPPFFLFFLLPFLFFLLSSFAPSLFHSFLFSTFLTSCTTMSTGFNFHICFL